MQTLLSFLSQTVFSSNLKAQLLSGFFVLVVCWFFALKQKHQTLFSWIDLPVIVFLVFFNLSFLFSTVPYGFKEFLTFNLGIFLYFFIKSHNFSQSQSKVIYKITTTLLFAIAILLFWSLVDFPMSPLDRFAGFFQGDESFINYPNVLASFLFFCLPLNFYLYCKTNFQDQRFVKISLLLAQIIFTISFFATSSRGALLSFILYAPIALFLYYKANKSWNLKATLFLATIILASFGASLLFSNAKTYNLNFGQRLSSTPDISSQQSLDERFVFFKNSLKISKNNLLWGTGSGSFGFQNPSLQTQSFINSEHPHNLFLKLLSENGIIAAVSFLIWIALIWLQSIISIFQSKSDLLKITLFSSASLLLISSLIDYNLGFPIIWISFFASLALFSQPSHKSISDSYFKIPLIILTIFFLAQSVVFLNYQYSLGLKNPSGYFFSNDFQPTPLLQPDFAPAWLAYARHPHLSPATKIEALERYLSLDPYNNFEAYWLLLNSKSNLSAQQLDHLKTLLQNYNSLLAVNSHHTVATSNPLFAYLIYDYLVTNNENLNLTEDFNQFKTILFQELIKFDTRYQTKLIFKFFDELRKFNSAAVSH